MTTIFGRFATTPVLLLALLLAAQAAPPNGSDSAPEDLLRDAQAKYRQGQYTEAIERASRAIAADGKSVETYRLRAAAYEAQGRRNDALADWDRCIELQPDDPGAYEARGELRFKLGRIRASIADFDRYLAFHPDREPHHWQRGISYYYAGEYKQGVRQFTLHQTVNPQDVENAIWHYLCQARVDGVESARAALIDITRDRRPWAMKVYQLFQGQATPQQVLAHAEQNSRAESERKNNLFYAHLYIGLFHEAAGRPDEGLKHVRTAVTKYPSPHYMGDVARVHLQLAEPGDRVGP